MGDVNLGLVLQRSRRVRHEEITAGALESLNDRDHSGAVAACHGDELGKIAGTAGHPVLGVELRQTAEHPLGRFEMLRIFGLNFGQDFVRMRRKGVALLALDSLQIGHCDGPALPGPMALASVSAGAHQGVLEHRESVLFLPGSEEQAIADRRVDLTTVKLGRLVDGTQEPEVVQPREEVLARVDRLGEALEAGTLAEVVRAHGENDEKVRGRVPFARQGAEQLGQERGLLAALLLGISKQLLELVDEQAQGSSLAAQQTLDVVEYGVPERQTGMPGGSRIDRLTRAGRRTETLGQG